MSKSITSPLKKKRGTLSPYRSGYSLIRKKLKWDLNPQSWRSTKKLKELLNLHSSKKGLILCNGPSLNDVDFDKVINAQMNGLVVIGLNKINLLFERTNMRPDYIVAMNEKVIAQNADFFNQTNIPLLIHYQGRKRIQSRDNVTFLYEIGEPRFARDISSAIGASFTVTFSAMQVAFHLGIRDLALVGCDHSFAQKGPANATVASGDVDINHFHPKYFSGGLPWDLPDLIGSEYQYSVAGEVFAAFDGQIINCTSGGKLKLFPKMHLVDWLTA